MIRLEQECGDITAGRVGRHTGPINVFGFQFHKAIDTFIRFQAHQKGTVAVVIARALQKTTQIMIMIRWLLVRRRRLVVVVVVCQKVETRKVRSFRVVVGYGGNVLFSFLKSFLRSKTVCKKKKKGLDPFH